MNNTDRQEHNPKNRQVILTLPVEYVQEVDEYRKNVGLSRSAVLRMRLLNPATSQSLTHV